MVILGERHPSSYVSIGHNRRSSAEHFILTSQILAQTGDLTNDLVAMDQAHFLRLFPIHTHNMIIDYPGVKRILTIPDNRDSDQTISLGTTVRSFHIRSDRHIRGHSRRPIGRHVLDQRLPIEANTRFIKIMIMVKNT